MKADSDSGEGGQRLPSTASWGHASCLTSSPVRLAAILRMVPAVSEVDPLDLVETIREGLLVLDPDLTVRFANRSFCDTFAVTPEDTVGRKLYELGNGQWDIPELHSLIENIVPERETIEAFEVDRVFPSIDRLCARQLVGSGET